MVKRPRRSAAVESLDSLYRRLGFLLRRAHQISEAIFQSECGSFGLTPPQCGSLVAAFSCPGLDQKGIGLALGFDRATAGEILKGLEVRGLVVRTPSKKDGRRRSVAVTPRGKKLLEQAAGALDRSQERLLKPFSPQERELLTSLLERLCESYNDQVRAPLVRPK
jgi:DNA-binding MarR family transcriptional regulator